MAIRSVPGFLDRLGHRAHNRFRTSVYAEVRSVLPAAAGKGPDPGVAPALPSVRLGVLGGAILLYNAL